MEECEGEVGAIATPRHLATRAGNMQLAVLAVLRSLGHAARIDDCQPR
jgi:hypothetical protein